MEHECEPPALGLPTEPKEGAARFPTDPRQRPRKTPFRADQESSRWRIHTACRPRLDNAPCAFDSEWNKSKTGSRGSGYGTSIFDSPASGRSPCSSRRLRTPRHATSTSHTRPQPPRCPAQTSRTKRIFLKAYAFHTQDIYLLGKVHFSSQ